MDTPSVNSAPPGPGAPISRLIPNVSCSNINGSLFAMRDQLSDDYGTKRWLNLKISLYDLAILELFAHWHTPREVYERINTPEYFENLGQLRINLFNTYSEAELNDATIVRLAIGRSKAVIQIFAKTGVEELKGYNFTDLTQASGDDPRVGVAIFKNLLNEASRSIRDKLVSYEEFIEHIRNLQSEGLLTPDLGFVEWGHLWRKHPLCQAYGFLRGGTPVDRYYLDRFVELIRPQVSGDVLEIGGRLDNKRTYELDGAARYRTLDLPGIGEDIEGDATDPAVVGEQSFDCILAFNVLEHCENPPRVVDNIHRWLKPGGRAMVLVPTAQKLHSTPKDYWRPLPDALECMFQAYSHCELHIYGNLKTVIASFHGISAEEIPEPELAERHPDYPVVSCAVAVK